MLIRKKIRRVRSIFWNSVYRLGNSNKKFHCHREEFLSILPKQSVGIELGVFRGEFSKCILQIVEPREIHLVDVWWTLYGDKYPNWGAYTDFGRLTTRDAYGDTVEVVKQYGEYSKVVLHVGDDLDYMISLPDDHLDWAYIDSSHQYEHTKRELHLLKDKVKGNGLITGHDWVEDPDHIHHGVCKAVREFCNAWGWTLVLNDNFAQWVIKREY